MRQRITAIGTFCLCIGAACAQNLGEIQGLLKDDNGHPIEMASVVALQGRSQLATYSDETGHFVLKPLPAGVYDVRIAVIGQAPREIGGIIVDPEKITFLKDEVFPVERTLDTVLVVRSRWEPPLIIKDDPARITLFHTQFAHSAEIKTPVALIANYAPGVYKAPNGDGLFFRGARSENMCYFVDGVKLGSSLSGVPGSAINSFSVYTGGLPARYGDVTGGVVAIETKGYFDLYQQRNAGIR